MTNAAKSWAAYGIDPKLFRIRFGRVPFASAALMLSLAAAEKVEAPPT